MKLSRQRDGAAPERSSCASSGRIWGAPALDGDRPDRPAFEVEDRHRDAGHVVERLAGRDHEAAPADLDKLLVPVIPGADGLAHAGPKPGVAPGRCGFGLKSATTLARARAVGSVAPSGVAQEPDVGTVLKALQRYHVRSAGHGKVDGVPGGLRQTRHGRQGDGPQDSAGLGQLTQLVRMRLDTGERRQSRPIRILMGGRAVGIPAPAGSPRWKAMQGGRTSTTD